MALHFEEKKSPVTVEGHALLWSVRRWPKRHWCKEKYNGLSLIVEAVDDRTRRPLVIDYPFDPDDYPRRFLRVRPTLRDEEVIPHIETAITLGWRPASRGKPFLLQLDDADYLPLIRK